MRFDESLTGTAARGVIVGDKAQYNMHPDGTTSFTEHVTIHSPQRGVAAR
jgi:hypothetical protein